MHFEIDKKNVLGRPDKSKKGEIDAEIQEICRLINEHPDYYTTSSCSGRIILLEKRSEKKNDAKWILAMHKETDFETVKSALKLSAPDSETNIWLKQEGAIIHACCRTINDAGKILAAARNAGFKRAGIISAEEIPVIEIISSEQMSAPVVIDRKQAITDEYLKILISEANQKMQRNKEKLRKLEDNIRRI